MNSAPPVPARWKGRVWLWAFPLGVALHAGLIFWLGARPRPPAPPDPVSTRLLLAADAGSARQIAAWPGQSDPTLFALPNGHGFSGQAWWQFVPENLAAANWSEPPSWLALRTGDLGSTFAEFIATNRPALPLADTPPPAALEIFLPNDTVATASTVRIEGALARRPLAVLLVLPVPAHPDVLPGTVVQLAVNAGGQTESAMLLAECGVKAIDQRALELARAAQFQPAADASTLTWGKMIFDWRTVPPVTTNGVSARVIE